MTVIEGIVLVLHLLGMAAILGGWFATRQQGRVVPAVLWGARAQIVTGLVLVGIVEATSSAADPPNHPKLGVKLLVALAVVACVEIANARQSRAGVAQGAASGGPSERRAEASGGSVTTIASVGLAPAGLVNAAVALTLLNVLVAVLWT